MNSETKVLTSEEIRKIIDEVAPNTNIVRGEFIIIEGWDDHKSIEESTGISMEEIAEIIAGSSDNWGFSDEYTTCGDCGGLIKTSPDSYSWTADHAIINDCELVCGNCIRNNRVDDYLQDIINNPKKANTILNDVHFEEVGFEKLEEEYESGWYNRNDDPQSIFNKLNDKYEDVVFSITGTGQFHTNFICWVRNSAEE